MHTIRVQRPVGHSSAKHYPSNKHKHTNLNGLSVCICALVAIKTNRMANHIKLKPHTDLYDLIKHSALRLGSKESSLFFRAVLPKPVLEAPPPASFTCLPYLTHLIPLINLLVKTAITKLGVSD